MNGGMGMNEEKLMRLRLSEQLEETLGKYIADRRYKHMMTMYLSGIVGIGLIPFAVWELEDIRAHRLYHRRNRESVLILCIIFLVTFLVLFIKGIGSVFGRGSDFDCVKHQKYRFGTFRVGGKRSDSGQHPYYVCDADGNEFCCPVYLDYKKVNFGDTMICVLLDNGKAYAMRDTEKPGWEME